MDTPRGTSVRSRTVKSSLVSRIVLGGLALTALQVLTGAAPATAAAVRWASPTGTGTACTQVAPCDLDTAVEDAAVVDGDEVVVTPGAYTVTSLEVTDAIILHGQEGEARPTITTGASVGVFDAATVRDLNFVHTANSAGLWVNAAGAVVERVTSRMTAGGGVACSPVASSTWRDSVCWATGVNTMGMGTNASVGSGTRTLTLRNLTVVGDSSGLGISFSGPGVNVEVDAKNVIASSADIDVRALASQGATVIITLASSNYDTKIQAANNGGTAGATDPGTGTNQTAAPVFVDAANGDFHQAEGSPTVDAGVADPANGTTDFEGDPRASRGTAAPCPALVDIGADERVTALECDPPDTSFASGPDGTTSDTTPTFDLASDESGVSFECAVDSGSFEPCTTPYTTTELALGAHTVHARATDGSGNVDDTPATRSFTVVSPPVPPAVEPDTTFTQTPKKKVRTKKKRVKVTFAFSSTTAGGFECSLDGAAFTSCSSPLTVKVKTGKHVMLVRAVGPTGAVDPSPASYTFKVKRKRPAA